MALLDVREVTVRFGTVTALDRCSLSVDRGRICSVTGSNGAGKSTLLDVVSGFVRPDSGTVTFDGVDLSSVRPARRARLGMARTFQAPADFATLTVAEVITLGVRGGRRHLEVHGVAMVEETLHSLRLDAIAHLPVATLSAGLRRRVDLARALASRPLLLVLDEPAAGLSRPEVSELATSLAAACHDLDLALLLVEHDLDLVRAISDEVLILESGRFLTGIGSGGTPGGVSGPSWMDGR